MKIIYKTTIFLVLLVSLTSNAFADRRSHHPHPKDPRRDGYGSYNDKYNGLYGFDPVPPNIPIAPGLKPGHNWRIGFGWYGNGDYNPHYNWSIFIGYSIDF